MTRKTISQEAIEQLRTPSVATLTTILRGMGLRRSSMHRVAPLRPDMRMVGRAYTLRYIPAREDLDEGPVDNLTDPQRVGIESVSPGEVFVIDARGDDRAGSMGAILATRLLKRGAAGAVTDGAFRDSLEIAASGLPAYARSMNAHANTTVHHPSEIQVPIACGDVAVFPGDVVVGDGEGVVVIPAHFAERVAKEAAAMEDREAFLMEKIRAGASLVGTYPPDEETLREYKESRGKP